MVKPQECLANLLQEFTRHAAQQPDHPFQASLGSSSAVSMLTRTLSAKREQEGLSAEEDAILDQITKLWEQIAKFNEQTRVKSRPAPKFIVEKVYRLGSENRPAQIIEPEIEKSAPNPKISNEQAQEIIDGLNQQFEEKVLSKLQKREQPDIASGRNLQDYLSAVTTGTETKFGLEKLIKDE